MYSSLCHGLVCESIIAKFPRHIHLQFELIRSKYLFFGPMSFEQHSMRLWITQLCFNGGFHGGVHLLDGILI